MFTPTVVVRLVRLDDTLKVHASLGNGRGTRHAGCGLHGGRPNRTQDLEVTTAFVSSHVVG